MSFRLTRFAFGSKPVRTLHRSFRKPSALSLEHLENRAMMATLAELVSHAPLASTVLAPKDADPVVVADTETETSNLLIAPAAAAAVVAGGNEPFNPTQLGQIAVNSSTGEKPQSKLWEQNGTWFAVMPDKNGTWVWRLDGSTWTSILKLSSNAKTQADVKQIGNVTHALLYSGTSTQLASMEYVVGLNGAPGTYKLWSARPELATIAMPSGTETATIDIDSTGRMWLVTDPGSKIEARYSDGNYSSWSAPITIASGIDSGDLAAVIAMPNGRIGVMWSNHKTERFGFRTHLDGDPATAWTADETPGGGSAQNKGIGMADDHLHMTVGSDGTVYAIAKTSYDAAGYPMLILMVRRPNGKWDPVYEVDSKGTRPTIVLSEATNRLLLVYTDAKDSTGGGGNIVYRESPLAVIQIGAKRTLISGSWNDTTTTKSLVGNQIVFLASSGSKAQAVVLKSATTPSNPTPPTPPSNDPPQSPPVDPTPTPPASSTNVAEFQDGVTANGKYAGTRDTMVNAENKSATSGTSKTLTVDGSPDYGAILSWDVSSIDAGSIVESAQIKLQVTDSSVASFNVYAVNRVWDEKTATWKVASKNVNWNSAGAQGSADHGSTVIGVLKAGAKGEATITLNAVGIALVQSWIDDPSSNFGVIIQNYDNAASDKIAFASREASVASTRPKLTIGLASDADAASIVAEDTAPEAAIVLPTSSDSEAPQAAALAASDATFNINSLNSFSGSATTGEKPQSKVWQHNGTWFAVMPDSSGTWVRRLDGSTWTSVLKLSTNKSFTADVKDAGSVAHVLLYGGSSSQLASIEYVSAVGNTPATYKMWSTRPSLVNISLSSGVETATIDVDSTGRMWLVSDASSTVEARYSDGNYTSWSAPITLATGISSDDISSVIAMPGRIGVFWSNQKTQRFGFRTHLDGDPATAWTADEVPASSSAKSVGGGFADDHLHLAVSSDGTLYAAVKTSYDTNSQPKMMLLVRRPNGAWDPAYGLDNDGTRAVVAISETYNRLFFIYTENTGGGDIIYRESPLDVISFSPAKVLMSGGLNDPTTTKGPITDQLVVLAKGGSSIHTVMLKTTSAPSNPPSDPPPSDPPSDPPADPPSDPPSDPPPSNIPAIAEFQDGVTANGKYAGTRDTMVIGDNKSVTSGSSKTLTVDGSPDYGTLISWDVSSIDAGSVVSAAQIKLQVTDSSVSLFNVYAMNRVWDEKTATWKVAAKGTNWNSAGAQGSADRSANPIGVLKASAKGEATITLNAAGIALVQSWVDDPSSNFGIIIQNYDNAASDKIAFASREASVASTRPKLSIAYSNAAAEADMMFAIAAGLDLSHDDDAITF